jgi:hypothetical protein
VDPKTHLSDPKERKGNRSGRRVAIGYSAVKPLHDIADSAYMRDYAREDRESKMYSSMILAWRGISLQLKMLRAHAIYKKRTLRCNCGDEGRA